MIDTFSRYILNFLHPISTQDLFRKSRLVKKVRPLMDANQAIEHEGEVDDTVEERELSLEEVISVSWVFVLVRAFYVLISVNLGISFFNTEAVDDSVFDGFFATPVFQAQKIILFSIIAEIVLFPLVVIIYVKFWEVIIKFFARLFGSEENVPTAVDQITISAVSSNFFLLIPIFGETLRHLAGLFYLFVGMKKNLNFTSLQSIITLASPLILLMMLFSIALFGEGLNVHVSSIILVSSPVVNTQTRQGKLWFKHSW